MRLRTLDRYTVTSILKTGIVTSLLACLMLMGVDLFSNLDLYMSHNVGFAKAFSVTILYFPEAFLLALGPSFLFAVTYQLSMLHAHNEIMNVLNSGVSLSRIVRPIIVLAVLLSCFYFLFNETVAIPSSNEKALQKENITRDTNSTNNQDIALSDMQSGYMVYAAIYSDVDQTLFDVSLVESDEHGGLIRRTDAYRAVYNKETGLWTFYDAYVYTPKPDGVAVEHIGDYENSVLRLEPQLFRNVSNEISTMSLKLAKAYLDRMKTLNPEQYASMGTEYTGVAWIEGPWLFKYKDTYYLQYSASGTQWKTYAEGYYTAKNIMGPYKYAGNNPLLRKTDGLVTGTAHGSVVEGPDGGLWQFYTSTTMLP